MTNEQARSKAQQMNNERRMVIVALFNASDDGVKMWPMCGATFIYAIRRPWETDPCAGCVNGQLMGESISGDSVDKSGTIMTGYG